VKRRALALSLLTHVLPFPEKFADDFCGDILTTRASDDFLLDFCELSLDVKCRDDLTMMSMMMMM